MSETNQALRFNALTDPWLPLTQDDGQTVWASPVEVLCGEKDGTDLDYPRDDFRVYARLLLSALVQALFPANDKQDLRLRLETPLARADVEARIRPLLAEFDLFGPTPFLQVVPPAVPMDKGAAPFVFGTTDLYPPTVSVDALSLPVALVTIFSEQTYSGGAGRGYGAGPGGQPGAFTLIDPGSVRRGAWANTLTAETTSVKYAPDEDHPWSNTKKDPRPRASIGVVGGLFFQPRSIWLIPSENGVCSFTGKSGPLVRLSVFLPKSKLAKKASNVEDVWVHPCAPLAVNSQGIAAIRLNAERPAWTGLAQLIAPLSRGKKTEHPLEGPARVLTQWKGLGLQIRSPRLLVLDFDRDKATIRRRFFEAFPLTTDLLETKVIERLRVLVSAAQEIERALLKALRSAHDTRKAGGLALADAQTSFWGASETPFWGWLATITDDDGSDSRAEVITEAQDAMVDGLRKTALAIFDRHAETSEFDPRKQKLVTMARRALRRALWPRHAPVASTKPLAEVSP